MGLDSVLAYESPRTRQENKEQPQRDNLVILLNNGMPFLKGYIVIYRQKSFTLPTKNMEITKNRKFFKRTMKAIKEDPRIRAKSRERDFDSY